MNGYDDINIDPEGQGNLDAGQNNVDPNLMNSSDPNQTPGQVPGQTPGQAPGQKQEVWDGQQWKFVYRGKDVIPDSRDKFMKWAQLGYSGDERARHLKEQEQKLMEQGKTYEIYERMNQAFETNPQFKSQLMKLYHETINGGANNQDPYGQNNQNDQNNGNYNIPPALQQKIDMLEQRLSSYESKTSDDMLKSEIEALKKSPIVSSIDLDGIDEVTGEPIINRVLKTSMEMGGVPLEVAFKHLYFDQIVNTTKANTLKEYQEQQLKLKNQGIVSGKGSQSPPNAQKKQLNLKELSYDDLTNHIINNSQ